MPLEFEAVARAALSIAANLCTSWFPNGKKIGHEYVVGGLSGEAGRSLSINLLTGKWADFATDAKGGDFVALYAAQNNCDQRTALHAVGALVGVLDSQVITPALPDEAAAELVPASAGMPAAHSKHGEPTNLYLYTTAGGQLLFVIARYTTEAGKIFAQWTWRRGKWSPRSWPAPRPLYGLPGLASRPDAPVLIVEGERCQEAASLALPGYVVLTWAGGAQAVKTADWSPLAGRSVDIWPDADPAGKSAAAALAALLLPSVTQLRVISPHGKPPGWDVADAIAEGEDTQSLLAWIEDRFVPTSRSAPTPLKPAAARAVPPSAPADDSAFASWQSLGLQCNQGGVPHPTLANVSLVLQQHPLMRGKIYYDSFRDKIYTSRDGRPREWRDSDDRDLTVWIQQHVKLDKANLKLVQQAVMHCAFLDQRNSFQDYVKAIPHDGTARLDDWVVDCLGCDGTEHHRAAGRNWILSMVARGFDPGCKADHMPVLEGKMGRGKSTVIEILGGLKHPGGHDWYASVSTEFGGKQFLEKIQGRLVVEIPDMAGFSKALHGQIIATLTTRVDPYRVPFDRFASDHPRRGVFAATSESSDYLDYPEGKRRYWPIRCGEINTDLLRTMRDQLFAEAYALYLAGATWHEMPQSTTDAQAERVNEDSWQPRIVDFLAGNLSHQTEAVTRVHSTDLLLAVGVELKNQHDGLKRRIKKIMDTLGWEQKVHKIEGTSTRMWSKR